MKPELGQTLQRIAPENINNALSIIDKKKPRYGIIKGFAQFIVMVLILTIAVLLMQQLQASKPERSARPAREAVYTVATLTANKTSNTPILAVYGQVTAKRQVSLGALTSGDVVAVNPTLQAGTTVKKGDTLFKINPFEAETAIIASKASLAEAKAALVETQTRLQQQKTALQRSEAQLALTQNDLERANTLLKSGTITRQVLEQRQTAFIQQSATVDESSSLVAVQEAQRIARLAGIQRLESQLANAQNTLENTTVKAPFDGIVISSDVEMGQSVSPSTTLIRLYEAGQLEASFTLPSDKYGTLLAGNNKIIGRPITANWSAGDTVQSYKGTITRIAPEIAANQGGITLFAQLETQTSTNLRPGAFITVQIPTNTIPNSIRIPETALYGEDTVYIIENNRLSERKVTIGAYDGTEVIVTSGLKQTDKILTTRIAEIGPGLKVIDENDANIEKTEKTGKSEGKARNRGNKSSD